MVFVKFIEYLILLVMVLVSVAFFTLLERKILGYIQIRKGPNKVGFKGLLQPFADAVKLFTKEQTYPTLSNFIPYYISPIFSLMLALCVWLVMPYEVGFFSFEFSVLFFLCCMSASVYSVMGAGWASNSKYSLLGCLRAVAQTISYEVSLALILLSLLLLVGGLDLALFESYQRYAWFILLAGPLGLLWFVSCLAESNRTPFDFAEGESELVSGFNTEYSGGSFALIFMAEYASILFLSSLFTILFLGSGLMSIGFYLKVIFIAYLFVWVRGSLPRYRYDKLMNLTWKSFLPISLNYCLLNSGMMILFYVILM
uniref:NADH-ubiquinone oxidoreductase chain 1 n=1 Tax=Palaemon gravieri TaxID=1428691 RepID=A0A0U3DUJ3_9EUCA|nr:NADH dehydrogenase subunit 1 [Palaemon gravieri]YP_010713893.1 NADH dehydrogenase subunit 1 [Palaemon tenuidactylus]ALT55349.1 NADH dehydrogenase subunit 1 [Palaemon gravieri]ANF05057.1 NADH dehydrogenase subunit 1 [Palaemon gravieri]WDD39113.1 NADH dehydrogenase subunit 1 [Palaemon tenuidactylus]